MYPQPQETRQRKVIDSNELQEAESGGEDLRAPCERSALATDGAGDVAPAKPKRPKTGAPQGNKNAYRHGLRQSGDRGDRRLLVLPSSPSRDRWADRLVDALRRKWEEAVVAQKGQLSRADEEAIQTAAKWELHSIRAGLWLRRDSEKITHAERMTASREVAEASERRDRALARLALGANTSDNADPFAAYFASRANATPTRPARTSR